MQVTQGRAVESMAQMYVLNARYGSVCLVYFE